MCTVLWFFCLSQVDSAEAAMCDGDYDFACSILTAVLEAPTSPDTRARALQCVVRPWKALRVLLLRLLLLLLSLLS